MGYLICSKCKTYYQLEPGESEKDYMDKCSCNAKLRYIENLDIVDPTWRPVQFKKKPTKKQVLDEKFQSIKSIPSYIKNRLIRFKDNLLHRFQNRGRWDHNPNHGPQNINIHSLLNELNFQNLQWPLIIPVAVTIALIYAFTPSIFSLLILLLLVVVGYLSPDMVRAIKNALITGFISFFIGGLLTESFLLLIPLTILGGINGAVCGWMGAYLKTRF